MQYSMSNLVHMELHFLHFVMVITVVWAELWFVIVCQALYFFSKELLEMEE
jgi:hypothetical protein